MFSLSYSDSTILIAIPKRLQKTLIEFIIAGIFGLSPVGTFSYKYYSKKVPFKLIVKL